MWWVSIHWTSFSGLSIVCTSLPALAVREPAGCGTIEKQRSLPLAILADLLGLDLLNRRVERTE